MLNAADTKQASLFDILNRANKTKEYLIKFMTYLNNEKQKIKTDLQAYLPVKLDGEFQKITEKLDIALQDKSVTLHSSSTKTKSYFQKKLKKHSKNEFENAINEANQLVRKLEELAQNSEDQTLKACYVAETRIDSIINSKQFTIVLNGKTKDCLNRYLNNHPKRLQ